MHVGTSIKKIGVNFEIERLQNVYMQDILKFVRLLGEDYIKTL
jgi:hypothetical protein